jgi:chromosome segregation ATPase
VSAIALLVALAVWLLRNALRDFFASPKQIEDLRKERQAEMQALQKALEEDIAELAAELQRYEARCDGRTTKFEEKLERGFATIGMLDGVGGRITAVDARVDGITTLFTQTRERADEAHEISRGLQKDLQHFMARIEEKIGPVAELQKGLLTMNGQLENLTRILIAMQKNLPPMPNP